MAAHLGRSIRGFVCPNKFSIHSKPLSALRPPMGARSRSSMPLSPDQAPREVKPFSATFIGGTIAWSCYWFDLNGFRTADKLLEDAFTREKLQFTEALLEDVQSKIDTIKVKPDERGNSYTPPEDKHLCLVYMDVSQDPITSNNQSGTQFWTKVMQEYNSKKPAHIVDERNRRSVTDRMRTILKGVKKFRNCIRQIENRNQSGISAKDIMDEAKELMMQDKEFKKGFKFEHVWPILKDMEVFAEHDGDKASHPKTPDSSSPALSSFSINLSDDSTAATTSKRPGGSKKAKTNKAQDDEMKAYAETLVSKTTVLADQLVRRQDYKIMMTDLNSITDPVARAYILGERAKIMQRSGEQINQDNTASEFGQFFQDLNPSEDDLPHY